MGYILKNFPRCARNSVKQYIRKISKLLHHLLGAMPRKLARFKMGKHVNMVPFFSTPHVGVVEQIGNFQKRKIRSHCTIFFITSLGRCRGNWQFSYREIRSPGTFFSITSRLREGRLVMHD